MVKIFQWRFKIINKNKKKHYTVAIQENVDSSSFNKVSQRIKQQLLQAGYNTLTFKSMESIDESNRRIKEIDMVILFHILDFEKIQNTFDKFVKSGGNLILFGNSSEIFKEYDNHYPVFNESPYYRLEDSVHIDSTESAFPRFSYKAASKDTIEGVSAVGFPYPEKSVFTPLLEAKDRYHRSTGWAAGLLSHYDGLYKGGHWIIFGITSTFFYETSKFVDYIVNSVKTLEVMGGSYEQTLLNDRSNRSDHPAAHPTDCENERIQVSSDRQQLVDESGHKLFIIGANYGGPFGNGFGFGNNIRREDIETDFKKAQHSGINMFRIWNVNADDESTTDVILELAQKYNIYLLIVLKCPQKFKHSKDYLEYIDNTISTLSQQSIVIGFDYANEPDIQRIACLEYKGRTMPILELDINELYLQYYTEEQLYSDVRRDAYPGFPEKADLKEKIQMRAVSLLWEKIVSPISSKGEDYSTFPQYQEELLVDDELACVYEAVNLSFKQWIEMIQHKLKKADKQQLTTIGYDRSLALLSANEKTDFISHHIYQLPTSYENIMKNLTTMDRLRDRWPYHPITLGEFGYSSGLVMPDGEFMDPDTASVGEMMIYLYAYSKGYSGAMIWLLNERPIPHMKHNEKWMKKQDERYEERFGLFYSDGTIYGRRKPIAHGTRFLRKLIDNYPEEHGKLNILHSKNRMQTGYEFKSEHGLFVGDTQYESAEISFHSEKSVNVMLMLKDDQIIIMTTGDVRVELAPKKLIEIKSFTNIILNGFYAGSTIKQDKIILDMFAGEEIIISN